MDLNKSFETTCRILFGEQIGTLDEFQGYLLKMVDSPFQATSHISGKPVYLSRRHYPKNARFISLDELPTAIATSPSHNQDAQKTPTLNINEIKDIDSLLSAFKERLYYCGNNNIGNCTELDQCDSCADSAFILNSHQVITSKYIAHCYGLRADEQLYGCMWCGEASFSIRSHGLFKSTRCWESYLSINSRGLYASFNCRNCTDTIFSFNQVARHNLIGNLELPRDSYEALKKKLLAEIAAELRQNKSFPSLFELVNGGVVR